MKQLSSLRNEKISKCKPKSNEQCKRLKEKRLEYPKNKNGIISAFCKVKV